MFQFSASACSSSGVVNVPAVFVQSQDSKSLCVFISAGFISISGYVSQCRHSPSLIVTSFVWLIVFSGYSCSVFVTFTGGGWFPLLELQELCAWRRFAQSSSCWGCVETGSTWSVA